MIEIAVAAQAAFKAYSLIKSGVEGGKEIEDMGKTVARWFQAKDDLDVAIKQEEQRKGQAAKDANTDPLAGSVWGEAAEYVEEQRPGAWGTLDEFTQKVSSPKNAEHLRGYLEDEPQRLTQNTSSYDC